MNTKYDKIGISYSKNRKTEPRIESQIVNHLFGAKKVLNLGAGAGSYEPAGFDLIAVEPSKKMIDQRKNNAYPIVQGVAEELPFKDRSFSHTMTILSMHHWTDINQAFKEINRVTTDKFIALTWNPNSKPFWLTRDYFPEIYELDKTIFPGIDVFNKHFNNVEVLPLLIPEDCQDGFLAAYWKRPEAYLNQSIRQSISSFSKLNNVDMRLASLKRDIDNGIWAENNKDIINKKELDAGYIIVTGQTR